MGGFVYVDKTEQVANLVAQGSYYFLSRPRRFGKSLLVDTLKQAFLANKELFNGLYLEKVWDWKLNYPVIHFDFGAGVMQSRERLDSKINQILNDHYQRYQITNTYTEVGERFQDLIVKLHTKFKQQVVLLIDEYDKPILDNINDLNLAREVREGLKNLYSVIKVVDINLKFVLLTGVSKFSKVSLFSGLNNLKDISLDHRYADICGYTQAELELNFADYLVAVDKDKLAIWYNGYNFNGNLQQKVYNPFDILLFFDNDYTYQNYWFETATPTFLTKLLQTNNYFMPDLDNLVASSDLIGTFEIDQLTIEALLFQSGYLTIEQVEESPFGATSPNYRLCYPNQEVRTSLNNSLLNFLASDVSTLNQRKNRLASALLSQDMEQVRLVLAATLAGIPYNWQINNQLAQAEGYYATIVYCLFNALGIYTIAEDASNHGRADLTCDILKYRIIMEFKLSKYGDASSALTQIKNKNYAAKYAAEQRPLYLIGISFDPQTRNITDFAWELAAE